ncbi:MAG TPA: type II toxin-antitoxin system RatA family toxin [Magnetospirillum sp.]|jgi:coenzyme Q-binding protein COQ10|nr:type II toxin-antitoxin system RatA family toxin [Magnetospirillum sp.]
MLPVTGRFAADFRSVSPDQMFSLAVDIEHYPAFIPWCRRAEIVGRDGDMLIVDNHFGAGPVDAGFRTRARPQPPHRLEITSADAPFRSFRLVWNFSDLPGGGCRVEAEVSLTMRSPILHGLARLTLHEASRKIIRRFQERAEALYGSGARSVL